MSWYHCSFSLSAVCSLAHLTTLLQGNSSVWLHIVFCKIHTDKEAGCESSQCIHSGAATGWGGVGGSCSHCLVVFLRVFASVCHRCNRCIIFPRFVSCSLSNLHLPHVRHVARIDGYVRSYHCPFHPSCMTQ